ncbi:hypothetical protein LI291_02605 [Intestinibacillus massiliensis]|nr:hypothetical protein [Intestinibacillus massiliensis]
MFFKRLSNWAAFCFLIFIFVYRYKGRKGGQDSDDILSFLFSCLSPNGCPYGAAATWQSPLLLLAGGFAITHKAAAVK